MIEVKNLSKRYKHKTSFEGIKGISFDAKPGEIICVLGESGSGKSTLLKCIAGLETPDEGSAKIQAENSASYVSQEYTLWPHLSILENLILAPVLSKKETKESAKNKAQTLLDRFELKEYAGRYPRELSGGQRQRVALLRAVMARQNVLLLDEITSALDPELIKSVLDLIRALAKDGYTMIIATHHLSFAMSLANRIIFLKKGRLIQDEKVSSFFANQKNPEIRSFILDLAKKDESIEVFKGVEQYQAYHLQLIKRLPKHSTIYVAGAVGDAWYKPMGEFYKQYEELRHQKQITWKMVAYEQGATDKRLEKEFPHLNKFKKMPRTIQNPANYNIFGDTVITQIFDTEPTIIQIKNQKIADAYLRFFEEMWDAKS